MFSPSWQLLLTSPVSMQMNLGSSQYLFTVAVSPSEMPCLCIRYDVDAIVLQPHPEEPENTWEHIATFNALGTGSVFHSAPLCYLAEFS